jgi:hypothetical protein
LLKSRDQSAFDQGLAVMSKLSITKEEMFSWHLRSWLFDKEDILTASWPMMDFLHASIVKMSDDKIDELIERKSYGNFDPQLFYFLYLRRKEQAFEYVENWILDHWGRINWLVMKTVLNMEYERYAPGYLKMIEDFRIEKDIEGAFYTYLQYNDFVNAKNVNELLNYSEEYFEYYINNIEEHENSFSSRAYHMGYNVGVYMPLHAWAVYFTLTNDEAKGKKMLEQLQALRVVLKEDELKMLKHVLGPGIIQYVLTTIFQKYNDKNEERRRVEYIFGELTGYMGQFDLNVLWQFDKYENKQTLEEIIKFLVNHDNAVIEKAVKASSHKNKVIRLTAVRILLILDAPETIEALKGALEKEKDDATRDLMWQICVREKVAPVTEETVIEMVESANKRGKLKKAILPGLDETTLPALYFQGGRKLTGEEVRFILYRMTRANGMHIDAEIKPVLQLIDRKKAADFTKAVFKVFEEKRFKTKDRFLLLLAAFLGNDDLVNKFCVAINKWIGNNRKVMCVYGIEALAIQGSNKALR